MSDQCEVAIVGGGPVGLLLACELGSRHIAVEVFDNKPGTSTHPKANTHTARSMEIYRRHGMADALRTRGLPLDQASDIAYYTRLFGHELPRVAMPSPRDAMAETRQPNSRWPAAEPQLRATQLVLEPLLLERALSFGTVRVNFDHAVTKIEQTSTHVDLDIDSKAQERRHIRARFVV